MAREEMNLTTVCPMIAGQNQPNIKATKIVESSGAPIRLDKMTRRRIFRAFPLFKPHVISPCRLTWCQLINISARVERPPMPGSNP